MWDNAVAYLHSQGLLDFQAVLQQYAPLERASCLFTPSVLQAAGKGGKGVGDGQGQTRGFFSSALDTVKVSFQTLYDKECGVHQCAR